MWPVVNDGYVNELILQKHGTSYLFLEVKGLPQQAVMAQGVPGRLRPPIFLTFGTTGVVGRQPYVPADFTPEEIPGPHF
jgi:hypothetical protein